MKLSNFDWTDKSSIRWFIIRKEGHEGPYDFFYLEELSKNKKKSQNLRIWAEGLEGPIDFFDALNHFKKCNDLKRIEDLKVSNLNLNIPLAKPIEPKEEVLVVPPSIDSILKEGQNENKRIKIPYVRLFLLFVVFAIYLGLHFNQKFYFSRPPKMSVSLHKEILKEFQFEGWNKFPEFKGYIAPDYSEIWLITSGFQTCDVNLSFNSNNGQLLSMSDENVAFKSKGKLINHVLKINQFEFLEGQKIIPGVYNLEILSDRCDWSNFWASIANFFQKPKNKIKSNIKLTLFTQGEMAFHKAMGDLIQKKISREKKRQKLESLFWQDLLLKYQTLQAITLQIQERFEGYVIRTESPTLKNISDLKRVYSLNESYFLTKFVSESENYFKKQKVISLIEKDKIENEFRLFAKKIGEISMTFLESLNEKQSKSIDSISKKMKIDFKYLNDSMLKKINELTKSLDLKQQKAL